MMRRLGLFLFLLSAYGCLAHANPRKKLADAVHTVNDAARWGRVNTVMGVVQPNYWRRFLDSHRGWGEEIQLADAEVIEVQLDPGEEGAVSVVDYSWYNLSTMTLHRTVVEQHWERIEDAFSLSSEQILKGDAALFTVAEEATSGGETPPG